MFKLKPSSPVLVILSISLLVSLTACSSNGDERPDYLDAATLKNLEIPPKLTQPDTSGALRLPEPSAKAKALFSEQQKDVKVIAPEFKGIELKNAAQLYWLEIDSSVEDVWASLPHFLAAEGINIARVEKLMGFVDTEWMNEYQVSYGKEGEGSSWFKGFSPDYKDSFRIRIAASEGDETTKTRLYVSHRGMQIVVTNDATQWSQRAAEPLLEREIMYRYMLYIGATKSAATDLLSAYRSYQPRVKTDKDNLSAFEVQGDRDTIWLRLNTALDRLGVEMIKSDKLSRKMDVRVGDLTVVKKPGDKDGGWFSGLFGRDISVDDDGSYKSAEYKAPKVTEADKTIVSVQQIAGEYVSTIKLNNQDGSQIESGLSLEFRNALVDQLK